MLDDADPAALRQYLQRLELQLESVRRRLKRFEAEHGLTSAEFHARLQSGDLQGLDYSAWAGEYETAQRLERQADEVRRKLKDE
jgi:hypothetical protein